MHVEASAYLGVDSATLNRSIDWYLYIGCFPVMYLHKTYSINYKKSFSKSISELPGVSLSELGSHINLFNK